MRKFLRAASASVSLLALVHAGQVFAQTAPEASEEVAGPRSLVRKH
jgi:hypothetical protein